VVTDHEHVEVLVDGVDRVGARRVVRGGQHVGLAARADDVRRVAAAGALGVVRVDRAALERRQRVLEEARLVERVGVDGHLHVELVGHGKAGADGVRRRAPVLVELDHPSAVGPAAGARTPPSARAPPGTAGYHTIPDYNANPYAGWWGEKAL